MIWIFTCSTEGCENNINPVYLAEITNPIECSLCHVFTDAVETDQPWSPVEPAAPIAE
jgi:hypothetical protein